jgi:hypothetical protein
MRLYSPKDYPLFQKWCEAWDYECPEEEYLPPNGLVTKRMMGFLYLTDSPIAIIEHLICDPFCRREDLKREYALISSGFEELAKMHKRKQLSAFIHFSPVIERAKRFGFSEFDKKYTLLSKEI